MSRFFVLLATVLFSMAQLPAQQKSTAPRSAWRSATSAELQSALPARAPVEAERIETEMSSASGIIDHRGRVVAAVVLITAGYAAQGKYSHFLLVQAPLRLGKAINLQPGSYVVGWVRSADGLLLHVYEAQTGKEVGSSIASPQTPPLHVVPVRIWPPSEQEILQIGRFAIAYTLLD